MKIWSKGLLAMALGAMTFTGAPAVARDHDDDRRGRYSQQDRGDDDRRFRGRGHGDNDWRHGGRHRRDDDRRYYGRRDDDRRYYGRRDDDRRYYGRNYDRRDYRSVRVIHAYDWNRPDPRYRGGYYPNYYYRGGYEPIRVTRATRIYRGYDDRYYCRRSDGTTGLIIGAALGGVLGNSLGRGDSGLAATLLGATAGGVLGHEIDRGSVNCR